MTEILQSGGGKQATIKYLETLDDLTLLKLHKYFFWADKKLHSVFFIEDRDQISEDLLIDFRSEKEQTYIKS